MVISALTHSSHMQTISMSSPRSWVQQALWSLAMIGEYADYCNCRVSSTLKIRRGAAIAWRMALYYPSFVTNLIAVAMPYIPPAPSYIDPETIIKAVPTLGYWRQYISGVVESQTRNANQMRAFLNAEYLGATRDGRLAFDPKSGVDFQLAHNLELTPLMSQAELEFYEKEYLRNGLQGPCEFPLPAASMAKGNKPFEADLVR